MNTIQQTFPGRDLSVAFMLAQLLERLERSRQSVGAEQYRSVATHLADEFAELAASGHRSQGLQALLDASPAAAELYENLHYREAGLCRSPLEPAVAAELQAKEIIERAKRGLLHGKT